MVGWKSNSTTASIIVIVGDTRQVSPDLLAAYDMFEAGAVKKYVQNSVEGVRVSLTG